MGEGDRVDDPPMKTPSRAVFVALCLAVLGPFVRGGHPRASNPQEDLRSEYFAIRPLGATPEADPVALVAWKRNLQPGGWVLEAETLFGEGGSRVLHTENMAKAKPRLVWRELGSRGRTWLAEWTPSGGLLETMEFGAAAEVHGEQRVGEVRFPLDLVETCRSGGFGPETFALVAPTGGGVVEARLVERSGLPHDLPSWARTGKDMGSARWVELLTAEGVQLASYLFQGERLLGLQWAAGTPWALPVTEQRWEAGAEAWRAAQRR